ncbi:MAG: LysM peptidoglycan-binding domain-containing protein [Microgenomates group bacterium]
MEKLKKFLKKIKDNESLISLVLGILVVLVAGALVINYFRNRPKTSLVEEETVKQETTTETQQETQKLPTLYTVKKGDNLWKIAEEIYGSGYNWVDLAKENNLKNPNILLIGQELKVPPVEPKTITKKPVASVGSPIEGDTYTVVKGDHLWGIALRAYGDGYQWVKIARENKLANPNLIHPGNVLKIPR